jgi:chorismate mutase/prephenate dehydratase
MSVEFEPLASISAVFDEVARGHAEFGLVPIENSVAGGIGETIDALIDRDVRVCGELLLAVHHHLLGTGPLDGVERICSKPEVFHQCEKWLASTGHAGRMVSVASTSAAADLASSDPKTAAIASELAAEIYGLNVLAEHVEDDPENTTRFLIIGDVPLRPTGRDKTSIAFGTGHRPGTLADVLDALRTRGINMTRIESRPNRQKRWEHFFLVDLEGHAATTSIGEALEEMSAKCSFWKVLGSYPAATEIV